MAGSTPGLAVSTLHTNGAIVLRPKAVPSNPRAEYLRVTAPAVGQFAYVDVLLNGVLFDELRNVPGPWVPVFARHIGSRAPRS